MQIEWAGNKLEEFMEHVAEAPPELQAAIMSATLDMDQILVTNPDQVGESRAAGERVLITGPLAVTFGVNVRLQKVLITAVTIYRKR